MSLKGQDMDDLTEKMYEISESQGEWLTKDELKQYASVSDEGRTAITNYLKSQGLRESDFTFSDLGDEVEIRSSVDQASKMLSAKFESFSYRGKDKVPKTKEYTVDASIADFVQNIYPIANFQEIKAPDLLTEKVDARNVQHAANAPAGCNLELVTPQCVVSKISFHSIAPMEQELFSKTAHLRILPHFSFFFCSVISTELPTTLHPKEIPSR